MMNEDEWSATLKQRVNTHIGDNEDEIGAQASGAGGQLPWSICCVGRY